MGPTGSMGLLSPAPSTKGTIGHGHGQGYGHGDVPGVGMRGGPSSLSLHESGGKAVSNGTGDVVKDKEKGTGQEQKQDEPMLST